MSSPSWDALLPRAAVAFAPDFMWGVASSAFQSEGGDVANDWVELARSGRMPANPGNGFWQRAEEDFRLVAGLGFRHYRLSIEWSRVEPARGRFDERAIDRYRAICDAATAAGLTPWVNLFHFTHPTWLRDRGGFLTPDNHDDFIRYVERMGRALAPHARHYHSQNESMLYVLGGYFVGELPPFVTDRDAAYAMTRHVLQLHARAYDVLKAIEPRNRVATIEGYLDFHPADPHGEADIAMAAWLDAWCHGAVLRAFATGVLELPGMAPCEIRGLAGALDYWGLNYYAAAAVGGDARGTYADLADPPRDAMGRAVHPAGLERGLQRVAEALPGTPILVAENGCPTTDESFRIRYLASHLAALDRARRAGIPVCGYFHWTAVDNYEWSYGFGPERFGLIAFDPDDGTRRVKESGRWFARLIAAGRLDPVD